MLSLFSGLTLFLAFAVHRRSWRGPRPTWLCGCGSFSYYLPFLVFFLLFFKSTNTNGHREKNTFGGRRSFGWVVNIPRLRRRPNDRTVDLGGRATLRLLSTRGKQRTNRQAASPPCRATVTSSASLALLGGNSDWPCAYLLTRRPKGAADARTILYQRVTTIVAPAASTNLLETPCTQ